MISDHSRISIITLASRGMSNRQIALTLGVSRNTVARVLNDDQKVAKKRPAWYSNLDTDFIIKKYKHFGSAVNLHQNMIEQPEVYGLGSAFNISLRSVQLFIKKNYTEEQKAFGKRAINAFHCLPGQQMQIDFTSTKFPFVDGEREIHIFEVVLSYSRLLRCYVCKDMTQYSWLSSICRFVLEYGVPSEILCDNDRSLVSSNDGDSYVINPTFAYFCKQIGSVPKPCRPFRPQTKGRVERAGGYIKGNCLNYLIGAGVQVKDLEDLQQHLDAWCVNSADKRPHDRDNPSTSKTVAEVYLTKEKDFLVFPKIDQKSLRLQTERFIVNKQGQITFFGMTCQIEDKKYWRQPVIVAIMAKGDYIISAEGGATICKGMVPQENLRNYPFKEKPIRRAKSKTKEVKSKESNVITYGQRTLKSSVANAQTKTLQKPTEGRSSLSVLDEMFEGDL